MESKKKSTAKQYGVVAFCDINGIHGVARGAVEKKFKGERLTLKAWTEKFKKEGLI